MADPTFEEQVNEVVSEATVDENGNLQLPEGKEVSSEVLYAAKLEKRHRDTQGSYTKSQQRVKALEAENAKLAENWEQDAVEALTNTEKAELEELKAQDTDAYIKKVAEVKENAKSKFQEKRDKLTKEVNELTEVEIRASQLEEYNKANPDAPITDDSIENDVPPRIVKKLEKGEITFDQFLKEANKYITTPKKVKDDTKVEDEPNLDKVGAGTGPSDRALNDKSSDDYSKEIY